VRHRRLLAIGGVVALSAALGACAAGPGGSSAGTRSPDAGPDAFAGLTYRLDLPAGWITLGTTAYDARLDATPDVARWLRDLELAGPNAFRAYEPLPGGAGLRLAVNPPVVWNSDADGPLVNGDLLDVLQGITGEVEGTYVAFGNTGKAVRFRWTQELDWGSGSPTSRDCVGYQVMTEFDPVNIVFTFPSGSDRVQEVEALMATFEVLGNPAVSLPPGTTPTPSPTPYDKYGSPEPVATPHSDPVLEAVLPDSVDGRALTKTSRTGAEMGITDTDTILKAFGKHPADISGATAMPAEPPLLIISVTWLRGVSGADLLEVIVADIDGAKVSQVTIGGRSLTYVVAGAWPVWYYPTGEYLYGIAAMSEDEVSRVLALLP
jgi:hypothetical protein